MNCAKPVRIIKNLDPAQYPEGIDVPCGKCLMCRIAKRREWTMRMIHELAEHDKAGFITLTYDESQLPDNGSLKKKDYQDFLKRLRKSYPEKIKYFGCGEYGEKYGRPHYHLIMYGIGIDWIDREYIFNAWKKGIVHYGLAEPESMQYTAKYIEKQLSGEMAEKLAAEGKENVFKTCSQGIGLKYALKQQEQIKDNLYLTMSGKPIAIPRYYINKLGIDVSQIQANNMYLELDEVEELTGKRMLYDDLYKYDSKEFYDIYKKQLQQKDQKIKNLLAKKKLKESKL